MFSPAPVLLQNIHYRALLKQESYDNSLQIQCLNMTPVGLFLEAISPRKFLDPSPTNDTDRDSSNSAVALCTACTDTYIPVFVWIDRWHELDKEGGVQRKN